MLSSGTAQKLILAVLLYVGLAAAGAIAQETGDAAGQEDPGADPFAGEIRIDAEAEKYMRAACSYLKSQPAFSVHGESTFEQVFRKGRRLQRSRGVTLVLKRPDRLWAEVESDKGRRGVHYDGKILVVSDIDAKVYGRIDAPATVEAMLLYASQQFNVDIPLPDLVSEDPCAALETNVERGWYLGKNYFDGGRYHHLLFSTPDVDLQVWVSDGKEPLFRKLVLTYKTDPGEPQYGIALSNWNFAPQLGKAKFEFTPASGAHEIKFVTDEAPETGATKAQE